MYLLLSTFFKLPLKPIIAKTVQDKTCSHHCSGKYIPLPYIYTLIHVLNSWVVRYVSRLVWLYSMDILDSKQH